MRRLLAPFLTVALMCLLSSPALGAKWQELDAEGLKEMMDEGDVTVVYPLSRIEYNDLHIKGSINIPMQRLVHDLPEDKSGKLVFYCLGPT